MELDVASEPLERYKLLKVPYHAALQGNWLAVKKFYDEHRELVSEPLTVFNDSALHLVVRAVSKKHETDFIQLIKEIPADHFEKINIFGNTVLSNLAMTEKVNLADAVFHKNIGQLEMPNEDGDTPLFIAAACGNTKMVKWLAMKAGPATQRHLQRKDSTSILQKAILGNCFEAALEVIKLPGIAPKLTEKNKNNDMTCLQTLANMPSAFRSGAHLAILSKIVYFCLPNHVWENQYLSREGAIRYVEAVTSDVGNKLGSMANRPTSGVLSKMNCRLWECLAQACPGIQQVWDKKKNHEYALQLVKVLVKLDKSWMENPTMKIESGIDKGIQTLTIGRDVGELQDDFLTKDDIPLLAAAKHGIIEIVKATLEKYPQAIEYVNEKGVNALHVAVRYRREKIFEHLLSFKMQLTRLVRQLDSHGNSILHQMAVTDEYHKGYHNRPGEALHMQWEIQWFERVNGILPHQYSNHRNDDNQTAQELFTKNHEGLVKKGREWLRRTAKSCTVVAALIATVAFTSAYTIPGGSDKKSGTPVFLEKQPFLVFTASDALSLSFSLTSLVIFLSIMTAPFNNRDFHLALPLRLVFGLTSLFWSVAFMMVAFAATLVLMFQAYIHWAALPIYFLACYPVTFFFYVQFPLYVRLTWYTVKDLARNMMAKCSRKRVLQPVQNESLRLDYQE